MPLEFLRGENIVVTWSGGLDSTALIAYLIEEYQTIISPIFINRGQRNYKGEKGAIQEISKLFREKYEGIFNEVFEVKHTSPPTEFKHRYPDADITKLYVMRNSDLVNQAVRYAVLNGWNIIASGSTYDDAIDPMFGDNTVQYWQKKTEEVRAGTLNPKMVTIAPFVELKWKKKDIIKWCLDHSIPIYKSWSCWNNNSQHCGTCRACISRKNSFREADTRDKTKYNA